MHHSQNHGAAGFELDRTDGAPQQSADSSAAADTLCLKLTADTRTYFKMEPTNYEIYPVIYSTSWTSGIHLVYHIIYIVFSLITR